jgi:hypothetical protein
MASFCKQRRKSDKGARAFSGRGAVGRLLNSNEKIRGCMICGLYWTNFYDYQDHMRAFHQKRLYDNNWSAPP